MYKPAKIYTADETGRTPEKNPVMFLMKRETK